MRVARIFPALVFAAVSLAHTNVESSKMVSTVDLLIETLRNEKWDRDEHVCYNKIMITLQNAKNSTLWAHWVLDSIQLPSGVLYGSKYQLGNYDECMKAPWSNTNPELNTKYCLADVMLSDDSRLTKGGTIDPNGRVETYVNTLTKHGRKLNTITWGVCVPSSCDPQTVSKLLRSLLRISSWGNYENPVVTVDDCQVAGQPHVFGTGVYVFWYLLLSLFIISVTSTWYLASFHDTSGPDTLAIKLCRSFCMNKNTYDLVKPSDEEMPVLHGMRVMTAFLFVFTHQIFFLNSGAVGNGLEVDKDLDKSFFMCHTDLFTDTCLFLSGLLLAKGLVAKEKLEGIFMVLWKRYIRLIGPMALIVFYMAAVSIHAGSGPIWHRLAGYEQKTCEKNWWLSLLMLNNYVKSEEMCFIVLWYLPADFQLTILGVILIYLYRSHRRLGQMAIIVTAALAVLLPGLKTYWSELPALITYNIPTMIDIRTDRVFNSTYIKSHYRIGSYLVGLAFGYLFTVYKSVHYRNKISKKWSIVIFALAFTIAWIPMSLGGVFYTRPYNALESAIYAATNRIVWVSAIGTLVILAEYGQLPVVTGLLSWSAWVPLSRLSYGLYVSHAAIIQYNVFSTRSPLREHAFTMLSDSFGPFVLGYLFSLVIWLLVQAPIVNLTNILYAKKKNVQELSPEENLIKAGDDENRRKTKIQ